MKLAKRFARTLIPAILAYAVIFTAAASGSAALKTVPAFPAQPVIQVGSAEYRFDAYNVDGSFCFALHDIAYALEGTEKRFRAAFDGLNKELGLTAQSASPSDGEAPGEAESVAALWLPCSVYLNGAEFTLTAYVIGDSSYVRLRDLAAAVGFGVEYLPDSGIIELDPSAGYATEKAPETSPEKPIVTFIGDSIGIAVAPYLKEYYPDLYADAKVSRQFSAARGIVQDLLKKGMLGSVVVIELGTNGAFSESQMRAVVDLIGDRKIVFVNTRMPRSWCASVNQTISKVAAEYPNVVVADWYSASAEKTGYFNKDGVHTSSAGSKAMAEVIARAVKRVLDS